MTAKVVQPGKGSTYLLLGDFYTFLATGKDTGGTYGLVEMVMQPQSVVPPHNHYQADEAHYIIEGEIEYQLEDQTIIATSGMYLQFPKGDNHGFKNIGSKPAKILVWATPSGPELFFAEVGQPVNLPLTEEEKSSLLTPPNPADLEKAIEIATTKYAVKFIL
ncbi:cupin domain-containing protein [Nostoc sp. CENA67]|uniref:Cupin domain-containing protein n=1 Tax=Amazonocrinis nigriterrae CENA67 TaxID=2794033 RepID=A0A8J7HXE8_9NOST|nr:cupin domain-containing protein [Amazonocrinis nigriterrae]MBH8564249.1 cupin domain-containing protein [Amazonocrinis nigriterrae CENA67]